MAYGQPFYTYGNAYSAQNNGYIAPQPQYGNLYGQPQQMPQGANNGVTGQYQTQQSQTLPPRTNKILVTSLTDAMSRTAEPNTEILYIDQDNPLLYQVSIDMQGRKTYRTFEIKDVTEQTQQASEKTAQNIDLSAYATKDDLRALENKISNYADSLFTQSAKPKSQERASEKTFNKQSNSEVK